MSVDENKALVHRFFDEVVNEGNLALLDRMVCPTFLVDPDNAEGYWREGPEGMKQLVGWVRGVFPDLHFTVDVVVAEGDNVVARTHASGTQHGEYLGHPATGLPVAYTEFFMFQMVDGKIAQLWNLADQLSVLQQIGAAAPLAPPALESHQTSGGRR